MLRNAQILVAAWILVKKVVREVWYFATVDGHDFVFVVEELNVLCAPAAIGGAQGEKDEFAVAVDVEFDVVFFEALRDGSLIAVTQVLKSRP